MDIGARALDLYNSLGEYKPEYRPPWMTGEMFNAVVTAAKAELKDDPIIDAITTADPTTDHRTNIDAGTMRAALWQIASVLGATT